MYVMRGSMPLRSMTYYMKQLWLKAGVRAVGRWMIPDEPFREAYFLDDALRFREALKLPLVYVGGLRARGARSTKCSATGSSSSPWPGR